MQELNEDFKIWEKNHKYHYLYVGASENHPFNSLLLKDNDNVLYCVNTFGNDKISRFLEKNKEYLIKGDPEEVIYNPRHFNNYMSIWNGLPWEVDWFRTMISGKEIFFRKTS